MAEQESPAAANTTPGENPADVARIRAASVLRRCMHLVAGRELGAAQLDELAAAIEPLLEPLAALPGRVRDPAFWRDPEALVPPADGAMLNDSLHRPISGSGAPFSIPMDVRREGDSVVSTVTLDSGFEGAPGRSHGGFVSAIFDDLLGSLPMLLGKIGFTASLTVNYLAPSPVFEPVTYRGWIDRVEGKKIFVAGEARHGDTLVTTATGLFIDATETLRRLHSA